jgi:hypothetical protein
MLHKGYKHKRSVGKKILVVGLKRLDAKTNGLVVNHQSLSNCDSDFLTILRGGATQQPQRPQLPSAVQACPATVGEMSAPSAIEAEPTASTMSVSSGS